MILMAAIAITSCAGPTQRAYKPFVRNLDGKSELAISTYPAVFPWTKDGELRETDDELYFQVFVRDRKTKCGTNPHVQSILIKSFAYQLDDRKSKQLLNNYPSNFWLQNNPNFEKRELPAVPYKADSAITVEIRLNLNGTDYSFEGKMPASKEKMIYPPALARS